MGNRNVKFRTPLGELKEEIQSKGVYVKLKLMDEVIDGRSFISHDIFPRLGISQAIGARPS